MSRLLSSLMFLVLSLSATAQFHRFVSPIDGVYGRDFIIVNYVDWSFSGASDYQCGTKTYDGHQGTDYVLKGFYQKQNGVDVLAVDSGVVTYIHDGAFDEETSGDTSLLLGNFICIKHIDNYYSYYGHLKNTSMTVAVGDRVSPSQKIAEVGSSGNSTDPHLHFELWYDSLYLVDPFGGLCGNDSSFWIRDEVYDTSFHIWESGAWKGIPSLNDLRHRTTSDTGSIFRDLSSDTISYWNLQYGIHTGDVSKLNWYCLEDSANYNFSYSYTYPQDYWYYYFSSWINLEGTSCRYSTSVFDYYLNDVWKDRVIIYHSTIGIDEIGQRDKFLFINNELIFQEAYSMVSVYASDGRLIIQQKNIDSSFRISLKDLPDGLYILECKKPNHISSLHKLRKM